MYGLYSKDIDRIPNFTKEEINRLCIILGNRSTRKKKEEARQKLVLSCTRLIIHIAKEMYRNAKAYNYTDRDIDFDEIVQMCNFAAVQASQYYDPSKGIKFSSFMAKCIRRNVGYQLGAQGIYDTRFLTTLDERLKEDDPTNGERTENPKAEQPLDEAKQRDSESSLYAILENFDEKKRTVLILRAEGYAQEDIAAFLGMTHQRISQIERLVSRGFSRQYKTA